MSHLHRELKPLPGTRFMRWEGDKYTIQYSRGDEEKIIIHLQNQLNQWREELFNQKIEDISKTDPPPPMVEEISPETNVAENKDHGQEH